VNKKADQTYTLLFIFTFTIASGILRKWVFTSYAVGNIIFFIQLLVPYLLLVKDFKGLNKIFSIKLISFFLLYLFLQVLNPLQKTFLHGPIGILLHAIFWITGFYYLFNKEKFNFQKYILVFVIIAFGEIVLGAIQYGLPQGHFLNRYAAEQNVGNSIAAVGSAVRITGTFSYISGFSAYLLFHALFVWGLILLEYRPAITISLLVAGLFAAFMNGSRGATYVYIFIFVVFLIFEARKTNISKFIFRLIVPAMLLYMVILLRGQLGIESTATTALDNFQTRRNTGIEKGEEKSRFLWDYYALVEKEYEYPLFGIGIGSTYQGAVVLWGQSEALIRHGYVESELERYVLEGGFFLLLIRLILTVYFCRMLFMPNYTKWMIGGLMFIAPITFNIFNIVFFMVGIIFLDQAYIIKYNAELRARKSIQE
jgi:hypothetical protein